VRVVLGRRDEDLAGERLGRFGYEQAHGISRSEWRGRRCGKAGPRSSIDVRCA
jgi:hypothetical protein